MRYYWLINYLPTNSKYSLLFSLIISWLRYTLILTNLSMFIFGISIIPFPSPCHKLPMRNRQSVILGVTLRFDIPQYIGIVTEVKMFYCGCIIASQSKSDTKAEKFQSKYVNMFATETVTIVTWSLISIGRLNVITLNAIFRHIKLKFT